MLAPSPMSQCAPMTTRSPIVAPGATITSGPMLADRRDSRRGVDQGRAMDPGHRGRGRMQDRRDPGIGRVRIGRDELGKRRRPDRIRRDDDGTGTRRGEQIAVLRVGEEGDVAAARHARASRRSTRRRCHRRRAPHPSSRAEIGERQTGGLAQWRHRGRSVARSDCRRYLSASALITLSVMSMRWLA